MMKHIVESAQSKLEQSSLVNLSRRQFMGTSVASLVLAAVFPGKMAMAQSSQEAPKPGTETWAFVEIRPDSTVLLHSAFVEGGQGVSTAMAQIVGEELDLEPSKFTVVCAEPNPQFLIVNGRRLTGGSLSVRSSYDTMRRIGASARMMLMQAAAKELGLPVEKLATDNGKVVDPASGRSITYGQLAQSAALLELPKEIQFRKESEYRWIGKPVPRIDVAEKSTGKARYAIDQALPGMLLAAVVHAPRYGMDPDVIANEAEIGAMPGVHSIHRLPGAVAVVADKWWRARKAVESLRVQWKEGASGVTHPMPADFSSEGLNKQLQNAPGPGVNAENVGDVDKALSSAAKVVEASYSAPFLAHAQMEPASALARFNDDGTLEVWVPNQMPDVFQTFAAKTAGLENSKVILHSPILGGFFGRHFLYPAASAMPQAILLAKAVGKPVKVIWSREQEFLRDSLRPLGVARFKAALDDQGMPVALSIEAVGEGPIGRAYGRKPDTADRSAVEGMVSKPYAIANRRIAQVPVNLPAVIGFWRSVGHSMNDYFYESFFDQMAAAGGHDPFELRLKLLADKPRQTKLLRTVAEMAGGWRSGIFTASDGSKRARGVALVSAFGTEVATMAEVSLDQSGQVVVHDIWVAIDPGKVVNPLSIEAQVRSAVALGLSETLAEEYVYENGMPKARNYGVGGYQILRPTQMPKVHVSIIASGEAMGGIGEPGLPGVPPAVINAVAALTGQYVQSLPLSRHRLQVKAAA